MRCVDPFVKAGQAYACGRCLPCKFVQRRVWFNRIMLEASQHEYNAVCTLTYDDAACPVDGELRPEHLRNWLKRYRKRQLETYPWRVVRFYACAEYGEKSGRPHYHVVLFGAPGCDRGRSGRQWCGDCGCVECGNVTETWGLGACSLESFGPKAAAYICGYVTRKVLMADCSKLIKPFCRMSRQGGIGVGAMMDIASVLMSYGLERRGVPVSVARGSTKLLLGRYLRRKLNEYVGGDASALVASASAPAYEAVLEGVRLFAWENSVSQKEVYRLLNEDYASRLAQRDAQRERVL